MLKRVHHQVVLLLYFPFLKAFISTIKVSLLQRFFLEHNSYFFLLILGVQKPNLLVNRSLSIQLIDSFAQTECNERAVADGSTSKQINKEQDMVDSGVEHVQRNLIDEQRIHYASTGDEDEAVIVENIILSEEVNNK